MKEMALSRENGERTEGEEARRYQAGFSCSPSPHAFLVNWALRRAPVVLSASPIWSENRSGCYAFCQTPIQTFRKNQ